jgi:hypothetical protein
LKQNFSDPSSSSHMLLGFIDVVEKTSEGASEFAGAS